MFKNAKQVRMVEVKHGLISNHLISPIDWMEMMMMQNHQMHQLVVQQMMLQSLPGAGRMTQAPVTYMSEPTVVVSHPLFLSLSLSPYFNW